VFEKVWLFLLLTWHFMSSGVFAQFDARNHTVVVLPTLGTMLVLPLIRCTVEVVLASCHYCSSKPCLLFGPFEARSLQERWLCKKYNFRTGTSCHGLKEVLNRDCTVQKSEVARL